MNIALFGVPGAGKGTQAEILAKRYNMCHISTGELVRKEIAEKTKLGIEAKSTMDQGKLLDDKIISDMLKSKLEKSLCKQGFLFDGYPRTLPQTEIFDKMLLEKGLKLSCVIELLLSEQESTSRILKRAKSEGRSDDNLQAIKARFEEYHKKTAPITEHYKKMGIYYSVNGSGNIEEIQANIVKVIEKLI